jgi:site-specific DNA-methyltransferase (cytosine-N4-specific)
MAERLRVLIGDALEQLRTLPSESVQCVVTSPPYWQMRVYGVPGEIGLEPTPAEYVAALCAVFDEVARVLSPEGVLWLNLGDTYTGGRCGGVGESRLTNGRNHFAMKRVADLRSARGEPRHLRVEGVADKSMVGMPWRVALALIERGWRLRSDVIWAKPNAMPESVRDRPSRVHEYLFMLSRSERYYFDSLAVSEHSSASGERRNARSVWSIATQRRKGGHTAKMPPRLAERCIRATSRPGDVVLDPFAGTGTTLEVALRLGRHAVGIELDDACVEAIAGRTRVQLPLLAEGA